MKKLFDDVTQFHHLFQHPAPTSPTTPNQGHIAVRKKMIMEEAEELCQAIDNGELSCIAQEACDLAYVAIGTIVAYGLPAEASWNAVHSANMSKRKASNMHQKPIKPRYWIPPNPAIELAIARALK